MIRRPRATVTGLALVVLAACGGVSDLETRTFELEHLEPDEAIGIVEPYVYADREESPGKISRFPGGITVRETPDNLERIGRVLDRHDREAPAARLRFQLIEADGDPSPDPRIAGIEPTLRELFRFEGYRLIAETQMGAVEGGQSSQVFREGDTRYRIVARVHEIRSAEGGGRVFLEVALVTDRFGEIIETAMRVPADKTVVLGSARPDPERGALVLAVRPVLVSLDEREPAGAGAGAAGTDRGE